MNECAMMETFFKCVSLTCTLCSLTNELMKEVCGKEAFSVAYAQLRKEMVVIRVKRRGQAALEVSRLIMVSFSPCFIL